MYDNAPDYSKYSIKELEEVLDGIDKTRFPDRYEAAKAILVTKREQHPEIVDTEETPLPPRKWSDQPLLTRIVFLVFFVLCFSLFPNIFNEIIVAKSWSENTVGFTWIVVSIVAIAWPVCVIRDPELTRRLSSNIRGKVAIVFMPFILMLFAWLNVRQTLPLGLHYLSAKHEVRQTMSYQKQKGKRYCRQRVEILETAELEKGDLCMTKAQRDSLPEKGEITVLGTRSQFGMVIDGFRMP